MRATMRRALLLTIIAACAALLVPAHASAHSATAGWTTFYGEPEKFDRCALLAIIPPRSCPTFTGSYLAATAWRWNSYAHSWSKVTVQPRTTVYQYPFSGSWVWIWSSSQGWLATEHRLLHPGTISFR